MESVTTTQAPAQRRTNPNPAPIRRQVRRVGTTPDGIILATCKSKTRTDGPKHAVEIDLQTCAVSCSCEHFQFRLAKAAPSLRRPATHCKHISQMVAQCERRGEVKVYSDEHGPYRVEPTGYSFEEEMIVEADAINSDGYDLPDSYWEELAQRAEHEAAAGYRA